MRWGIYMYVYPESYAYNDLMCLPITPSFIFLYSHNCLFPWKKPGENPSGYSSIIKYSFINYTYYYQCGSTWWGLWIWVWQPPLHLPCFFLCCLFFCIHQFWYLWSLLLILDLLLLLQLPGKHWKVCINHYFQI